MYGTGSPDKRCCTEIVCSSNIRSMVVSCAASMPRRDTLDETGNFDNGDLGTRLVETLWLCSSIER